jgi:hypothetical protein
MESKSIEFCNQFEWIILDILANNKDEAHKTAKKYMQQNYNYTFQSDFLISKLFY